LGARRLACAIHFDVWETPPINPSGGCDASSGYGGFLCQFLFKEACVRRHRLPPSSQGRDTCCIGAHGDSGRNDRRLASRRASDGNPPSWPRVSEGGRQRFPTKDHHADTLVECRITRSELTEVALWDTHEAGRCRARPGAVYLGRTPAIGHCVEADVDIEHFTFQLGRLQRHRRRPLVNRALAFEVGRDRLRNRPVWLLTATELAGALDAWGSPAGSRVGTMSCVS
jgi:hypothetical protein